jgi:predicted DNA-binding transcriptional regulator AlpA
MSHIQEPPTRLFSASEAAHWVGVSLSFLNKLRLTGEGPPYAKIGRRVCYDQADLAAWLESQKRRSTRDGQ